MSRAVELMVAHVENLRRRHDRNVTEMEDSKKNPSRNVLDHRASPGFSSLVSWCVSCSAVQHLTDKCISSSRARGW